MEIVDPLAVTDAAYISSNLTEDDYTEWAAGQTLVRGDYRMVSSVHSVYQCLVDHTSSSTARAAFNTAVNNSGGYSSGATSIVVDDAGAADTGINAGDTISIGAVKATVQSVDRGTETLVLTAGLSAAVADDAVVTRATVASNSPLSEAAAAADPLVADPDPAHWVYISQTNKWRLFDGRPSQKTANALEIDAGIVLPGRICAVGIIGLEDCSAATIELVHNGDTAELAWSSPTVSSAVSFDSGTDAMATGALAATDSYIWPAGNADTYGLEIVDAPWSKGNLLKVTQGGGTGDIRINLDIRQTVGAAGVLHYSDTLPTGADSNTGTNAGVGTLTWNALDFTAEHILTDVPVGRYYWFRPGAATTINANSTSRMRYTYNADVPDSTITGYQYRYRTGGSAGTWSDWTDMTGATAATTQWTVEGLNPDLSYEFQVRAVNDDGNGGDSNTAALVVTSQGIGSG